MRVGPGNLSGFILSLLRHRIPAQSYWGRFTMASTTQATATAPPSWHAAYPAPKTEAPSITREAVLEMLRDSGNVPGKDLVLVDLRRVDHEVCSCLYRYPKSRLKTERSAESSANREAQSAGPSTCPPRASGPRSRLCMRCSRQPVSGRSSGTAVGRIFWRQENVGTVWAVLTTRTGSSRGRGNRAAGWFADYIAERGDSQMQSLVLLEGIKGWATAGPEYVQWMDEYDQAVWQESKS